MKEKKRESKRANEIMKEKRRESEIKRKRKRYTKSERNTVENILRLDHREIEE